MPVRKTTGFVGAVALLIALVSVSVYAEPVDDARFKRINLVVADIDRSLKVYGDILGFTVDSITESSSESYSYPVFKFPKEAKLRFATLSGGDEQVRTFALTEVKGIDLEPVPLPYRTATVIKVNDIKAVIAAIEDLGLETVRPETDTTPEGVPFTEQVFYDYDGHLVVLYQLGE